MPFGVFPVTVPATDELHAYVVPLTFDVGITSVVLWPLHKVCGGIAFIVGSGLTVTTKFVGVPGHPLAVGIIE